MVPHYRIIETDPNGILNKDNRHRLERVLRLRLGDKFFITDGNGREAEAILETDGRYSVENWYEPNRETNIELNLFVALSKGDRFEWIIEKAVEMGVRKIIPIITDRCIVKDLSKAKLERWNKIAESAMIQCGGCILPEVTEALHLHKIPTITKDIIPVFLYEEKTEYSISGLKDLSKDTKQVWILSGPEGGFSETEVDYLKKSGWKTVWLGRRLFRMDTAPIVAIANVLSSYWL